MKDFDVYLRRAIRSEAPDWSIHYVDYESLKKRLQEYAKRRTALSGSGHQITEQELELASRSVGATSDYFQYQDSQDNDQINYVDPDATLQRISTMERDDFLKLLEQEVSKASAFYTCQLRDLENVIKVLSKDASNSEEVGNEILETYCFVAVNMIAIRQAIIRYDGFVRTYHGAPISEYSLEQRLSLPMQTQDIFDSDETSVSIFNVEAISNLEASFQFKLFENSENDAYTVEFTEKFEHLRKLLHSTFDYVERLSSKHHLSFKDRFIHSLRRYFFVGSIPNGLSMEPQYLMMRGRHLKKEMKSLAQWREKRGFVSAEETLRPENVVPLCLNLISCFLFMMNNYVIEPSSAYYAEALGSSDALAGIMIGAAPWFALLSAIGYSFWTNTSYKHPILFAGFLMLVGNLLYANAYAHESMEMCLIGRAIQGLGAPRIINRRYVADATPFSLRTAASAAFALATALGAALGPGMAIILDLFEFEFYIPILGTQYINGMTGPGYFMALSWTIYTACIIFFFKEPNRSGLDELKKREESAKASLMEPEDSTPSVDSIDVSESPSFDSLPSKTANENTSSPLYCIRHMTTAVAVCMSLIFMKRIALESIMGSTSVVTKNRYGWSIKHVGLLHTINGAIVIPVSILSGWLSQFYEDRYLSMWLLGVTLFGMFIMVDLTDLISLENETYNDGHWLAVGPVKYVAGSFIAFSGIEACESYVASLMSKVVPSALAVGTFNSGLLTTLVGTSGRATGDLFITLMGLISIRNLLNLLIIPGMTLMIISMVLIRRHYKLLAV